MPSEIVKHFYEEIKFLAAKIGELKLPDKFIEGAKAQNEKRIERTFEKLKVHNSDLWSRLSKLYDDYKSENQPTIFYETEAEDLYKYNPSEIDPLNLCFVLMLSHFIMSDEKIFENIKNLQNALYEQGHKELADYMEYAAIDNLIFDLIGAFGGTKK